MASQAAADSADADMRQDLAGDEMKSAAVADCHCRTAQGSTLALACSFDAEFLIAVVPQAVKRAKAVSAPVDPDRVSNLASAVICGLCDTAATGRWLQQHLDATLVLVSCVPASTFASVYPYCCKLVTLLAPQHSSAGSFLAASGASLALQGAAEDSVSQLVQSARACIAAASDGKRALLVPPLLSTRIVQAVIC
jgi:hypothetical protein